MAKPIAPTIRSCDNHAACEALTVKACSGNQEVSGLVRCRMSNTKSTGDDATDPRIA